MTLHHTGVAVVFAMDVVDLTDDLPILPVASTRNLEEDDDDVVVVESDDVQPVRPLAAPSATTSIRATVRQRSQAGLCDNPFAACSAQADKVLEEWDAVFSDDVLSSLSYTAPASSQETVSSMRMELSSPPGRGQRAVKPRGAAISLDDDDSEDGGESSCLSGGAGRRPPEQQDSSEEEFVVAKPRQARKQRLTEEEKQAKEADKRRKKAEQEAERERKAQQKEEEKQKRQAERELGKQLRGNHRNQEVMVVLEQGLASSPIGAKIQEVLASEQYGFSVMADDAPTTPGLIRWTRRPIAEGGAALSGDDVKELELVMVVWHSDLFCDNILQLDRNGCRHGDVDEFTALERAINSIRDCHRACRGARVLTVMQGVYAEIRKRAFRNSAARSEAMAQRTNMMAPGPDCERLEDARTWLLLSHKVESKLTKDAAETAEYVADVTKALAMQPYKKKPTDLDAVTKCKGVFDQSADQSSEESLRLNTWMHMLQAIPQVSEPRARAVVRHFPTVASLLKVFNDTTIPLETRRAFLADKLGGRNEERALARKIFTCFTCTDPNTLVN